MALEEEDPCYLNGCASSPAALSVSYTKWGALVQALGDSQQRIGCISLAKRIVNQGQTAAAALIQPEPTEALFVCVFSAIGTSRRKEIYIVEILDRVRILQ